MSSKEYESMVVTAELAERMLTNKLISVRKGPA